MRRIFVVSILVIALVVAVGVVGCGGGSSAAGDGTAPQQVLGSALTASENLNSATGTFSMSVKLDGDTSELPDQVKAILDKPITIEGTFAGGSDPAGAEVDLTLGLAGETMNFAFKATGSDAWLRLNGQWYETPPELQEAMSQAGTDAEAEAKMAEIMQLISDLGVDPTTWLADMTISDEKIDGVDTYHIKGTPDVAKMLTDLVALVQSDEFMAAIGSATEAAQDMDLSSMIPSPDEIQQAENEAIDMFKDTTVELWVGKEDSLPRQMAFTAKMVPPTDEADGLDSVTINATITLQNINQAVTITAPDSPLSFTDLQQALMQDPRQFLGPLGGLLLGGLGGF